MSEVVKTEPGHGREPSPVDCGVQASADDVPIVERRPASSAEDEVLGARLPEGEPLLSVRAERPGEGWHELDFADCARRLRRNPIARPI